MRALPIGCCRNSRRFSDGVLVCGDNDDHP
jgi:hypothetical protein